MSRTPTLPDVNVTVNVRKARRKQRRQVRRAGREHTVKMLAVGAMLVGAGLVAYSAFWPTPSTETSTTTPGKRKGPAASVPATTLLAIDGATGVAVGEPAPSTTAQSSTASTAPVVASTIPPSPASTIALAPFVPPTIPLVKVPPDARRVDLPIGVGVAYGVNSGNPHLTTGTPNSNAAVLSQVLPQPFRVQPRGDIGLDQELMLEAGEVPDPAHLIVTYRIRPDAVWSDGTPVSCDDFKLAYLAGSGKFTEANGANLFRSPVVAGYEHIAGSPGCGPDGKDVTVTFDRRDVDWRWLFAGLLPSHVVKDLAEVPDLDAIDVEGAKRLTKVWNEAFTLPVGATEVPPTWLSAGPFQATSVSASGTTFSPNTKFWGTPAASSFTVAAVGPDRLLDSVASGGAQITTVTADTPLVQAVAGGDGASIAASEPVAIEELVFNFRKPVLQQAKVRQALAACIDQTSLTASRVLPTLPGAVPTTNRMVRPFEPGFRSNKDPALAGIDKARELLTQDGFSFGSDGIAQKGAGGKLVLRVSFPKNSMLEGVAEGLVAQCEPAGIHLVPEPAALDDVLASSNGVWDVALRSSPSTLSFGDRTNRYTPLHPTNVGSYSTAKIVAAIEAARTETDPIKQVDRWNELDAMLWTGSDGVPSIPLFTVPSIAVHASAVTNVAVSPGPAGVFASARAWR
jgi:peptide/nickel transport system substrate-binding protein